MNWNLFHVFTETNIAPLTLSDDGEGVGRARHSVRAADLLRPTDRRARSDAPYLNTQRFTI